MNDSTSAARRRGIRIGLGALGGLALAIAAPLAASAHVHVTPDAAAAGATSTLTFSFSHGCDESPTTALVIDVPAGVANVTPVVQGGWTISREIGGDGVPTQVTFTADTPVEHGLKGTVSMDVLFSEEAANTSVAFPITQKCVTGETAWVEVPADGAGEDSVESPAPQVVVGPAAEEGGDHGHGDATATPEPTAHADHDADAGAAAPVDPVARWLSGAAIAAAVAAIVTIVVRTRPRKG